MVDHSFLSEFGKALHLYLDFSLLVCVAIVCLRGRTMVRETRAAVRTDVPSGYGSRR
jgi:hypothetical protein